MKLSEIGKYRSVRAYGDAISRAKLRKLKGDLAEYGINLIPLPERGKTKMLPSLLAVFRDKVSCYQL